MGIFGQRYPGQPGGRMGRIIIALLIALFGFFSYLSHVQENPITKEKQHVAISPSQEVALGLQAAPEMAREMGGEVPSHDPRTQRVMKLGKYLVDNTEARNSPWEFQFHLLADDQTVNAFALPGGQIFITLGLYNKLKNDEQLAGVLSHEMGHVIERHSAEHMAKEQLGKYLVFATGVSTDYPQQGAMMAQMVNQLIQMRFTRQDESEADVWGIKLMAKVGFDPHAMINVMEILKASAGSQGQMPDIFQTHPNPDLRIERIKAYIKEHPELIRKSP